MFVVRHPARVLAILAVASVSGSSGDVLSPSRSESAVPRAERPRRIAFAPDEGVRLRKVFRRELRLATRSGTPRLETGLGYDYKVDIGNWRDAQEVVLVDAYGPTEDGVPESIVRELEHIEMEHSHTWNVPGWSATFSGIVERAGHGELEGAQVAFQRDHAEDETPLGSHEASYTVALTRDPRWPDEPEEPDETDARIRGLEAAVDLTGMLPWREVEVGDSWFTDVESFRELCWPGGRLGYLDADEEHMVVPVDERLGQNLDGTFRVELAAVQKLDGVRYARLDFRGRLESTAAFEYEWVFEFMGGTYRMSGPVGLDLEASVDGTLWWDLDHGHADTVDLEADVEVLHRLSGLDGELRWSEWAAAIDVIGDHRSWMGTLTASARFERL